MDKKRMLTFSIIEGIFAALSIYSGKIIDWLPSTPMYTLGGFLIVVSLYSLHSAFKYSQGESIEYEKVIETVSEKSEELGKVIQENENLRTELEKHQKLARILNLLVEEGKISIWQLYQTWEKLFKQNDTYLVFEMGDSFPLSKALDESRKRRKIKFTKKGRELIMGELKAVGFIPTRSMFSNFATAKLKAIRLFKDKSLRMAPLYVVRFPKSPVVSSPDYAKKLIVESYLKYAKDTKMLLITKLQGIAQKLGMEDQENLKRLILEIKEWSPVNSALLVFPVSTMPIVLGSDKVSPEALYLLVGNEKDLESLRKHLRDVVFPYLTLSIYAEYAEIYSGKVRRLEEQENYLLDRLQISSWHELPVIYEKDPTFCVSVFEELADLTSEETASLVHAIEEIQNVLT